MSRDRRLLATPLADGGYPYAANPVWQERLRDGDVSAGQLWDLAARLPLLGRREPIGGVDMVEVGFLTQGGVDQEVLLHVNSLTDNVRHSFEPWLMEPVPHTPLHTLDLWLPADGCYSYRFVAMRHVPRDAGATREGWRAVHANGRPDPRNPERIVDPLGQFSSVWRGPDAMSPTGSGAAVDWEGDVVDCPDGESRPVWFRRGSEGDRLPLLVLFDGELWRSPGVVERLGEPRLKAMDVVLIDARSPRDRWRDLTSRGWGDQVRVVLEQVLPHLRRATDDPEQVILAGQSLGGLAAARLALGPDRVADRALCQSGSFWWRDGAKDPGRPGRLIEELVDIEASGSQFVVQVGIDEQEMVERSREFTAAARAAGAQVRHHEWRGGHDYAWWREGLVSGVTDLLG
ncbi:MAG: DUF3327 domain-containing protein [Arachnia propionica]|uniref:enterochelin esterase domain-containing protein n=1 Tax=Arachnia propionica TaxID=1750 RepID=UPI00270E7DF5|nr:DUF3327 domain-containing protein [Arachnia propionica]